MKKTKFAVFIWEITENGLVDPFQMTKPFFELPRRHDILVLDGECFRVCEIVQHHNKPFEPELYVKSLGKWDDFQQSDVLKK